MRYSYTVTESEPGKAWLIRSTLRDSVDLDDGADFRAWALERWPPPRYDVKLDRVSMRPPASS